MYEGNGIISCVNISLFALVHLISAVFPFVFNFIIIFFELYCVGLSKCLYFLCASKYFFLSSEIVVTVVCEKKFVLILLCCT